MTKYFLAVFLLAAGSTTFADRVCDTKLNLSCEIKYLSQGEIAEKSAQKSNFSYENEDEPTLWKCSTTAYFDDHKNPHTSVRVYVVKDFASNAVVASAVATQVGPLMKRNSAFSDRYYSNTSEGTSSVGQMMDLGRLTLPLPILINQALVTEIAVSCMVK